jgi:hypothetical protein
LLGVEDGAGRIELDGNDGKGYNGTHEEEDDPRCEKIDEALELLREVGAEEIEALREEKPLVGDAAE